MINSSAYFYYFHVTPLPLSLAIQPQSGNAVLSWPEMAGHFALLSTTNLTASSWTTNSSSRSIVGSQLYVANSTIGAAILFRLRYP